MIKSGLILQAIASKSLRINNILCSNLIHFGHLTETIRRSKDVKSVDFPVTVGKKSSFRVDIVCADNGLNITWIKVIARSPKALNDIAFGRSNYGAKSILDHAISYSEGANDNQFRFQNPKVNEGLLRNKLSSKYICITFTHFNFRLFLISLIKSMKSWRILYKILISKCVLMEKPLFIKSHILWILKY